MKWKQYLVAVVAVALLASGCKTTRIKDDPILRLSASESLEQGKKLLEEKKFREAKKYLIHSFEVEPNSAAGREGLLLAADSLFLQSRYDGYVEAESRYRDFLNRFPTSPRADYAQLRLAQCLVRRLEKPNRDQEITRKAQDAINTLLRLYPTSEHADEARQELGEVRQSLAEHEYVVGYFYLRSSSGARRMARLAVAAIGRFEHLLENYPDYLQKDKVLAGLCVAHDRVENPEKATEFCRQLRAEYPNSKYAAKIPKRLFAEGP